MRKPIHMLAATAFALSIVASGCTKGSSTPQPPPAKVEIARTEKKPVPKPRVKLFSGTIEAMDEAAGTLTLKGPKGEKDFHVRKNAKDQLEELNIGDKVIVKHVDETALAIVKPRTSKSALMMKDKRIL